jgi:uncharacterized protein
MRAVLIILAIVLAVYLAWLAMLYAGQRSMMFPGAGMRWEWNLRALPGNAELIDIEASFGRVRGVLLPAVTDAAVTDTQQAPALLYFHGNAEFVDQNAPLLQPLAALGMHVLLVEYPGYAGSDGSPTRDSLLEAGQRSHDWLARHPHVDPARIVVMGRSIGSGAAVDLAATRPVAGLILLSPFASLAQMARGMGAPGFLLRDPYDNRAVLADFAAPVLLFHGRRDEIIPYAHSVELADAAPHARLVTLDCRHNDCPYFDAEFVETVAGFLREAGVLDGD